MRLLRIFVQHLPGIQQPFELDEIGAGLSVIHGPNGIGKSSLSRAIGDLFWGEATPRTAVEAELVCDADGQEWRIERDGAWYCWRRGGVGRNPPDLPPVHLRGCFFLGLRALLDASDASGRDLAVEIRRQMAGGYDPETLAREIGKNARREHGKKERAALNAADTQIRRAEGKQAELAQRQAHLESLVSDAEAAELARRRLPHFDEALELVARREELAPILLQLEASAPALERVTGQELNQVDALEARRADRLASIDKAEALLRSARKRATAVGLAEPVDPALLRECRKRVDNLRELERLRDEGRIARQAAREKLAVASEQLGSRAEPAAELALPQASRLFAFLRKAEQNRSGIAALEQRIQLLSGLAVNPRPAHEVDLQREGASALSAWLRAPDPTADHLRPTLWPSRRWLLLVAASMGLVGAFLGAQVDVGFYTLSAVAVGLAVAGLLTRLREAATDGTARRQAERDFPAGLESPSAWSVAEVRERLNELQNVVARADAAEQRSRDRDVDRAALMVELTDAKTKAAELEGTRRELARALGLVSIPADAELVDLARAVDELRLARLEDAAAEARLRELDRQFTDCCESLPSELTVLGRGRPQDAASARSASETLEERDRNLRVAENEIRELSEQIDALRKEAETLARRAAELYSQLDLEVGERSSLVQLLERREPYRELCSKRAELLTKVTVAEEALARAGEADLREWERVTLESEREALEALASQANPIREQIAEIRAEVRGAEQAHGVEDAIAKRQEALLALAERRDEALQAKAGAFLLHRVIAEHESVQVPAVFERARSLFGNFTHQSYRLRVPADGEAAFVALEATSGRGLHLEELSDGTRAQLILAVRLAFAEEAERGERLPVVLDEALAHADPARFDAIARSLARMVADGERQVIYLTSAPSDLERFRLAFEAEGCTSLHEIDLAAVRGKASIAKGPGELVVRKMPQVPSPTGKSPEEYGLLIGATALDPRRDAEGQHLFHLLSDDLPLLASLLGRGIKTVGQWLVLTKNDPQIAEAIEGQRETVRALTARAELLGRFLAAWRQGRGRPVDRDVIERSDAISKGYRDVVLEVNRELGGDGKKLIGALLERSDERFKGFLEKKARAFEATLREEGYIDARDILSEEDIVAHLAGAPAARLVSSDAFRYFVHGWWELALH